MAATYAYRISEGTDKSATGYDNQIADGFNIVTPASLNFGNTQAGNKAILDDLLAKNVKGVFWGGGWNTTVVCGFTRSDEGITAYFAGALNYPAGILGHPALFAYRSGDEPLLGACPLATAAFAARSKLIHSFDPTIPTCTVIQSIDSAAPLTPIYPYWDQQGSCDFFIYDLYPVLGGGTTQVGSLLQDSSGYDFTMIPGATVYAEAMGQYSLNQEVNIATCLPIEPRSFNNNPINGQKTTGGLPGTSTNVRGAKLNYNVPTSPIGSPAGYDLTADRRVAGYDGYVIYLQCFKDPINGYPVIPTAAQLAREFAQMRQLPNAFGYGIYSYSPAGVVDFQLDDGRHEDLRAVLKAQNAA